MYWGNPYALADSDDDSNVPLAADVRATAIDVSTSVDNVSAVVPCARAASVDVSTASVDVSAASVDVSAASVDVSTSPVDLCSLESNAPVDASAYFADMSADVDVANINNVANINFVPDGLNHATSLYKNIMSASRREFTGRSVEPSNVTGINNKHEMWIRQVMLGDWGI